MGLRFTAARAVSGVSTWGLKNVLHRPAANFPGKMALYVDPQLIAHLRGKLDRGSVCVVGTNGKTTVSNLLADVLETSGQRVVCNRTGANLDSGVSTALLHAGKADWGVFECDELWLAKILPQLRANYVVLLNLFRDQLDRCGEIDRIQDSIVKALGSSPETVLVYNADDPLCASIADRAGQLPGPRGHALHRLRRGPRAWAWRKTPSPTPPCASVAPPCSNTTGANTGSWANGAARTAASRALRWISPPKTCSWELTAGVLACKPGAGDAGREGAFSVSARLQRRLHGVQPCRRERCRKPAGMHERGAAEGRRRVRPAKRAPADLRPCRPPRPAEPGEEPHRLQPEPQDRGAGPSAEGGGLFHQRQGGRRRDVSWLWDIDFEELAQAAR